MRRLAVLTTLLMWAGSALAMQNIKCIPKDRKLLDNLAEEAAPVLEKGLKTQLDRAREGQPPTEKWLNDLSPLLDTSKELEGSVVGDELKSEWGKVNKELGSLVSALKKAEDGEAALISLEKLEKLAQGDILAKG